MTLSERAFEPGGKSPLAPLLRRIFTSQSSGGSHSDSFDGFVQCRAKLRECAIDFVGIF